MIDEIDEGGTSAFVSAASERQSPQEAALAALLLAASRTGTVVVIDASRDTLVEYGGGNDDPALFRLFDRACNSIWTPEAVRKRHPYRILEPRTGRPAYMFGAGGSGPNALTQDANGCLVQTDATAAPIWTPNSGFTAWWKAFVPTPGSTSHGVTWGANTGGAIFGNQIGVDAQIGYLGTSLGNGRLIAATRDDGQGVAGTIDLRLSSVHTAIVTHDAQSGVARIWRNGAADPEGTQNVPDIGSAAGAARLALGAALGTNNVPAYRFTGIVYACGFVNAPLGNTPANRDIINAYLATR